jgi:hypothetical protein
MKKKNRNICTGLVSWLLAASLLATSCASTKLTSVWKDPDYQNTPRKILVLGMLQKPENRRLIEDTFVQQLKAGGVDAVAGYTILPDEKLAEKEVIAAQLKKVGADALFLTRVVDRRTDLNYVPAAGHHRPGYPAYYNSWGGYYSHGYDTIYQPAYMTEDEYAIAEANLYDVATDKLIWSAASETLIRSDQRDLIENYVSVIMKSLRKQQVIR